MNQYEQQALDFLNKTNTEMKIRRTGAVRGFPFDEHDTNMHHRYRVTLTRGDKKYSLSFYGSARNYDENKRITPYDVLACLQKWYIADNMWDFAREYGYTISTEKEYNNVKTIWKRCKKEYEALQEMYDDEEMDELREVS